jgi:hypothetical protein
MHIELLLLALVTLYSSLWSLIRVDGWDAWEERSLPLSMGLGLAGSISSEPILCSPIAIALQLTCQCKPSVLPSWGQRRHGGWHRGRGAQQKLVEQTGRLSTTLLEDHREKPRVCCPSLLPGEVADAAGGGVAGAADDRGAGEREEA